MNAAAMLRPLTLLILIVPLTGGTTGARAALTTANSTAALDADSAWHLHGVGIESGEEGLAVLRAGTVLAYEPGVVAGPDAFYLEDMILITDSGHEVLSSGLPYSAASIAELMRRR